MNQILTEVGLIALGLVAAIFLVLTKDKCEYQQTEQKEEFNPINYIGSKLNSRGYRIYIEGNKLLVSHPSRPQILEVTLFRNYIHYRMGPQLQISGRFRTKKELIDDFIDQFILNNPIPPDPDGGKERAIAA